MGKAIHYHPGDIIGDMEIVSIEKIDNKTILHCKCKLCGKSFDIPKRQAKDRKYKCCNACATKQRFDLTGQIFGRLKVVEKVGVKDTTNVWLCECLNCNNTIKVTTKDLKSGNTASCGCLHKEAMAKLNKYSTPAYKMFLDPNAGNKSGHTGVKQDERSGKWTALLTFQKKHYNLGTFATYEEAVAAREEAEIKYFGKFLEDHKDEYPEDWERYQKVLKARKSKM